MKPHRLVLAVALVALARHAAAQVAEPGAILPPPAASASFGAFTSGVPSGEATSEVLRFTLADVVARGLENNLGRILADERVRAASAERSLARSGVLPTLDATAAGTRAKISLDQFGFPVAPGESPLLGPFNVLDFRLGLDTALLDFSGLARTRAAAAGESAALHAQADARELVVTVCTALYLEVVAADSRLTATHAQLDTARALDTRARSLKDAGVVAAIDVLRAQYQLAAARQRQIDAEDRLAKVRLALARAIGLPLAQPFELVEREPYAGLPEMTVDAAMAQALANREEVQAQQAAVQAAEERITSVRDERLPSLWLHADWGEVGPDGSGLNQTYSAVALLKVPIFQGGAITGREEQAAAALAQQRAVLADLRARVELEVRSALLDVAAAGDRITVAKEQDDLAAAQLAQAQDRFAAGVTNNLEVVQAQEAVAAASDGVISGWAGLSLARLQLARAVGAAGTSVANTQGGAR